MLKLWLGKDGGSIIVSKSDPQHDFMQELGFKYITGFRYSSMNRLEPGDYTIYRAADYLGEDSIYRCMRINDDTDAKYIELKKDRHFRSKLKSRNKIVLSLDEIINVPNNDIKYLACAACKRIFRTGNNNRHNYTATFSDIPSQQIIEWEFRNIECCDKFYAVGKNLNETDYSLVCCTSKHVFGRLWGSAVEIKSDDQKKLADYICGRKEAPKVERDGR